MPFAAVWLAAGAAIGQGSAAEQPAADPANAVAAARRALAEGAPEEALSLVQQRLAIAPEDGDAHVVAGLALFHLDRPEAALQHFDQAIDLGVDDERRVIAFNRAACLFALGDPAEAERAFLASAHSPDTRLAALALVNAGHAALEQGQVQRAAKHLSAANARDQGDSLADVRADLSEEIESAMAETGTEPPATLEPASTPSPSKGLKDRLVLIAEGGTGYDSNPSQTGYGEQGAIASAVGSPFLSLVADASLPFELPGEWTAEPSYSISQVVYTAVEATDWSSQDHVAELDLEHPLSDRLHVNVTPFVALGVNLARFRPRSADTGITASIRFQNSRRWATEASVQVEYAHALKTEFDFLTGASIGGDVGQAYRHGGLDLVGRFSLRHEGLSEQQLVGASGNALYVVPLAYTAPGALLWARQRLFESLSILGWAQFEVRFYDQKFTRASVDSPSTYLPVIRQRDARLRLAAAIAYRLLERISLQVGYQLHVSSSNVDDVLAHYGDENFERHVGWLRATILY